jgi:AraC family transcriptional activator of pobA
MASITADPRMDDVPLHLFDPRLGQPALKVEALRPGIDLGRPQRFNYFTIVWVSAGAGDFWADLARHRFDGPTLLFAAPYQIIQIEPREPLAGVVIQFHANFLCIETYHDEIGCNGVLFNAGCGTPIVRVDEGLARPFTDDVEGLRSELKDAGVAQSEALVSRLKLLLIRATRAKLRQQDVAPAPVAKLPDVLRELRDLIEGRYRDLRRPGEYAKLLHVAPKTLARLVKVHLGASLTELLRERVMRQAKWEMLHTTKPVKQVARELGFDDVFYFSRAFKRATGCSPAFFRDYETAIRGGRNLSMLSMQSRRPSIPSPAVGGEQ